MTGLLSSARVLVVAGKGGVGKSTVTAVLARAAARDGRRVLAVGLDGKGQLRSLLGDVPLLELTAADALQEYLDDHGFGRIARRLNRSGVIDVVSTAAPGIDDIVVLGRIKQLEQSGEWDLIVVDGPAAGHAVTMLTSPAGLQAAVRGGPVRAQADAVVELLGDPQRSAVVLVTLAETTPVSETIETATTLTERVGVALAGIVVNAVDDPDAAPLAPAAALATHTAEAAAGPAATATAASGADASTGAAATTPAGVASADVASADVASADVGFADVSDADARALLAAARFRDERRAVQRQAIATLTAALPLDQLHLPVVRPHPSRSGPIRASGAHVGASGDGSDLDPDPPQRSGPIRAPGAQIGPFGTGVVGDDGVVGGDGVAFDVEGLVDIVLAAEGSGA